MNRLRLIQMSAAALLVALAVSACAPKVEIPYIEVPEGAGAAEANELVQQAKAAFAERGEEAKLRESVENFTKAFAIDPHYPGLGGQISWCYYLLGDFYSDGLDKTARKERYRLGRDYALKGLEANPDIQKALADGAGLQEAIKYAGEQDLAALFYGAVNWGRWGELEGLIRLGLDIPKIKALNERVLEIDESFAGYGAHRFFGAYWIEVPVGKDPEKAKYHFERSIEKAPDILSGKVLMAEYYYLHYADDRENFERLLKEVIGAKLDPSSPFFVENRGSQEHARELLDEADDLF